MAANGGVVCGGNNTVAHYYVMHLLLDNHCVV